jgi:hypothetical protein
MGTGGSYPGVKRQGSEADHPSPSSAEVKRAWSYDSTPQYVFMACCVIKQCMYLQGKIKFRECLLLFSPKSFVFPSHMKKLEDLNIQNCNFASCAVWVRNLVSHFERGT